MFDARRVEAAIGDRYRLERELGRGGMAQVWLARDLRHDRPVALKILRPELAAALGAERFLREIRLTARLQHPNILPVLDSGAGTLRDGTQVLWYTMPCVDGETLRARLAREHQLPVPEAVAIAREVADALDGAGRQGIVHRDVKPENILLGGGHALLADFGVAKLLADEDAALTSTGLALGTPAYMSPEQAAGDPSVDRRTDVYALGCVLYEMLVGEPPYTGPTAQVIAAHRLMDPVPSVRRLRDTVPPAVEAAIGRALAKVPADRFPDAAGFAEALQRAPLSGGEARVAPRRRSALWVAGAAGLALAAAISLRRHWSAPPGLAGAPIGLAVLPFRALGVVGDSGVLTIGLPDAIITRLAGVHQLRVRPTTAVLKYDGPTVDPQVAARELAVAYILTGTVQSAGERLRVSVQLLREADGAALWGAHYDLARQDLLTLQDSVAERVSGALALRMTAAEQARMYRRYTAQPAAYESYLRGRAQLARMSEAGTRGAVEDFGRALVLDPRYALARAGLAMASADMHLRFARGEEVAGWGQRAAREAARALQLDPGLAEAHLARAAVARKTDFDWAVTLEESAQALELNPNLDLARYFRAAAFYHLGLFDDASGEMAQALHGDPQNRAEELRTAGVIAFLQGRDREAIHNLEEARHTTSAAYADSYLSQAYFYAGDTTRSLQLLDSLWHVPSAPASARAGAILASVVASRGERGRANELIAGVLSAGYMDHHVAYSLGAAYAQLGRLDDARQWLERSVSGGFPCYPWFVRDTLLAPFRRDPGSQDFLRRLRARWEEAKARYG
ncbi:MAG: protein kinase domain-containing protein [Gemmatimonadales bacterium]